MFVRKIPKVFHFSNADSCYIFNIVVVDGIDVVVIVVFVVAVVVVDVKV